MAPIHVARLSILGVVAGLSFLILALSAWFLAVAAPFVPDFAALAIAIAIITLGVISASLIVGKVRRGAFTSLLVTEVVWSGVLWVLWIATAGLSAQDLNLLFCEGNICGGWSAIIAFSFINWLLLLSWFITLLVYGIKNNTWMHDLVDKDVTQSNQTNMMQPNGQQNNGQFQGQYPPYPQQQQQQQPQQQQQQQYIQPQQGYSPAPPMLQPLPQQMQQHQMQQHPGNYPSPGSITV